MNKTYVYTYDSAGNITKRQTYAFTTSSTLTSPITEDVYSYGDNSWGDLLTSYNGVNFTYDEIGNPLTYYNGSSHSMTWQNGRELKSLDGWEFKYNSDGVRIEKSSIANRWEYVVNGTRIEKEYLYLGDTLFSDTSYYYDANGYASSAIMNFYSQGELVTYKYLFVTNLQGDVIAVTDENGVWLITYTYDAWGNFTPEYNYDSELGQKVGYAVDLPFRYRSYYYDYQTGFYYLNSRYYDSKLCRFINADESLNENEVNLFSYNKNMPIHKFNISSCLDRVEYGKETSCYNTLIAYDVPLYDQGELNLCWAFAQLMIMDSWHNIETSNEMATYRAEFLAKIRWEVLTGKEEWNSGGYPQNIKETYTIDDHDVDISIELLYALLQNGPLFATYFSDTSGHAIVITGVDTKYGLVYTNNPWGITGVQNYDDFLVSFVGVNPANGYKLREIIVLRRLFQ